MKLGTRGSPLALAQSGQVALALQRLLPGLRVETVVIKTTGDRITDRPLAEAGGKGLFVKEIELALLSKSIDFAVHSYKDVPVTMPLVDDASLVVAAVPVRADPRDLLITPAGLTLDQLPASARVGTGSLRRRCQLLAVRPDLRIEPVRGNIDSRLRKLANGEFDAIVLAAAGVHRAALFDGARMHAVDVGVLLPAPGQGALALQCRSADAHVVEVLRSMNDLATAECIDAERELVRRLDGDCHSPIAAFAERLGTQSVRFRAVVGARDSSLPLFAADARATTFAVAVAAAFDCLAADGAVQALHPSSVH